MISALPLLLATYPTPASSSPLPGLVVLVFVIVIPAILGICEAAKERKERQRRDNPWANP